MLGPVVLQNCVLEHCRTESIAFTGPKEVLDKLRRDIRWSGDGT
jgi:hypothetical protein